MPPDLALALAAAAAFGIALAALYVFVSVRWTRGEAALNEVARTLGGRYTRGYKRGLVRLPGSVQAKRDGRHIKIGAETTTQGYPGDKTDVRWTHFEVGTSESKPEFLGPTGARRAVPEVVDHGRGPRDDEVVVAGQRLEVERMSKRLLAALRDDPRAEQLLAEHIASGGVIAHGNVIWRRSGVALDPQRMLERIEAMEAIAALLDGRAAALEAPEAAPARS